MLPAGRTPAGHVASLLSISLRSVDAPRRSHPCGARRFAPVHLAPLGSKCGNSHARWLLIESAQAYRNPPQVSALLSKRQEGQPRAVKELSWRAQNRLSKRYQRLKARGKHENKVKVAVARELCAFVWELHQILRDQLPASGQDQNAS